MIQSLLNVPSIETAVQQRAQLALQVKRLQDEIARIDDALGDYLDEIGQSSITVGDFKVSRVQSTRRTLDKLRLVEQGVLPDAIAAATKETKFSFVKVNRIAAEDSPEDGA